MLLRHMIHVHICIDIQVYMIHMFGYIASVTQVHNTCVHMYLDIASGIQAHDTCLHMC